MVKTSGGAPIPAGGWAKIDQAAVTSAASASASDVGSSVSARQPTVVDDDDDIDALAARLERLRAAKAAKNTGPPGPPSGAPPPWGGQTTEAMNRQFKAVPPPPAIASSGAASSAVPPPPPGPPTSWCAPPKGSVAQLVLEQTKGDGFVVTEEKLANYKPTVDRPDSGRPVQCKACARWCKQWRFMLQLLIYTTADWTEKAQTEQDN